MAESEPLPTDLELDVQAFMAAARAKGVSAYTEQQYSSQLGLLVRWLLERGVTETEAIMSSHLTDYLLRLRERNLKPNTIHAAYRVFRRYLRWYERTQPWHSGWRNPLCGIEAPKVPRKRLPAPKFTDLKAILASIRGNLPQDDRDRAVILFLCETGLRSKECLGLDLADLEIKRRRAHVRETKSGKDRYVYFDPPVDKVIVRYLRHRPRDTPPSAPLWVSVSGHGKLTGHRLTYSGLQQMLRRRATNAGVPMPKLHGLRRAFATAKHEQGVTALDLQRMLGHSDGQTLWRYVDIDEAHMERVNRATSVVSKFLAE